MRRTAIADGLADLPPPLQWLRRSFSAFYSGDVVLYFQRDGETYHVVSEIGTVQGDAVSGIFFNAGLQRAFNQLRAEYPEALLAKYADDANGAVVGLMRMMGWHCESTLTNNVLSSVPIRTTPPLCPIPPLTLYGWVVRP